MSATPVSTKSSGSRSRGNMTDKVWAAIRADAEGWEQARKAQAEFDAGFEGIPWDGGPIPADLPAR